MRRKINLEESNILQEEKASIQITKWTASVGKRRIIELFR